jgi:hypothetical protein
MITLPKDCDSFLDQSNIKCMKKIEISTLIVHFSYNYHKVTLN